jgi:hypothetical protein
MRGRRFWSTVTAAVVMLETVGTATQTRAVPQACDPIGIAIDPRGLPGSPLAGERSSGTQSSLRAIGEPTRGFALLDEKNYEDGMTRIRRAVLTLRR